MGDWHIYMGNVGLHKICKPGKQYARQQLNSGWFYQSSSKVVIGNVWGHSLLHMF